MDVAEVRVAHAVALDEGKGCQRFDARWGVLGNVQQVAQETNIEPAQHRRGIQRGAERLALRFRARQQHRLGGDSGLKERVAFSRIEAPQQFFDGEHGPFSSS